MQNTCENVQCLLNLQISYCHSLWGCNKPLNIWKWAFCGFYKVLPTRFTLKSSKNTCYRKKPGKLKIKFFWYLFWIRTSMGPNVSQIVLLMITLIPFRYLQNSYYFMSLILYKIHLFSVDMLQTSFIFSFGKPKIVDLLAP